METKRYTIGELSALSGLSVRKIRFYSDKGLLPPLARTGSGYRLYTHRDAAALSLISALREAGAGLKEIKQVLDKKLPLKDLLRIRLEILQAEIQIRQLTASVLRELLRLPEPGEQDLRRLNTISRLNNVKIQTLLEDFIRETAGSAGLSGEWHHRISQSMLPELPTAPTAEQEAAMEELSVLLTDPAFRLEVREGMREFWTGKLDADAWKAASERALNAARNASRKGISPDSEQGQRVAREWLRGSAGALSKDPDAAFIQWHHRQFAKNAGPVGRYRELMSLLDSSSVVNVDRDAWTWLDRALGSLPRDNLSGRG